MYDESLNIILFLCNRKHSRNTLDSTTDGLIQKKTMMRIILLLKKQKNQQEKQQKLKRKIEGDKREIAISHLKNM